MRAFFHLTLRTSDVDAARAFYTSVLGERPRHIVLLHEQAVARGARPHWLGFVDVGDDVDAAVAFFTARGALSVAPKWTNPEGIEAAVMRDPGGALVALAKPATRPATTPDVAWYQLLTQHVETAKTNYAELLGWEFVAPLDLAELGVIHPFAFEPGASVVGGMMDVNTRAGIHPHWLFHFPVESLDTALDTVRASGGRVLLQTLPDGQRIAVCEDPQGAAFALR